MLTFYDNIIFTQRKILQHCSFIGQEHCSFLGWQQLLFWNNLFASLVYSFSDLKQCESSSSWCGGCVAATEQQFICHFSGRFSDAENCSKFYECRNGSNQVLECWCRDSQSIFHPELNKCIPVNKSIFFTQNNITCRNDLLEFQTLRDGDQIQPNGTSEDNYNIPQIFTSGSENISRTSTSASRDNLHVKLNAISAFRRTTAKDITEKKWRGAFISYDYTRSRRQKKFSQSKVIHDKPSLPIWILAMIAYMCVIVIVVIAMYLYR